MFSPFSGFKELPIHVEVEWQSQTRAVVAWIEQLPTSPPRATVVCSFADAPDEAEWLLANNAHEIYTLGNLAHLLRFYTLHGGVKERLADLSPQRVVKLQNLIERAYSEWDKRFERRRWLLPP